MSPDTEFKGRVREDKIFFFFGESCSISFSTSYLCLNCFILKKHSLLNTKTHTVSGSMLNI